MTDRPPPKLLIVLSSSWGRAVEVGARYGIEPREILWPRTPAELQGHDELPLYADVSLWNHSAGYDLAGYFAARVMAAERRRAVATRLARSRG